jgi:3-oxoacyl-[acyl-carrier protein] reductase
MAVRPNSLGRKEASIVIDTGLKNKVVLITGANRGIGAATALALAAQGTKIFIAYLGEPPAAALVLQIERLAELSAFECDLADPSAPARVFDRAEGTFGGVDILINNAAHGIGDTFIPSQNSRDWGGRPTMFADASLIDRHFAVNVRAAALLIAEFARRHVARVRSGDESSASRREGPNASLARYPMVPARTRSRATRARRARNSRDSA